MAANNDDDVDDLILLQEITRNAGKIAMQYYRNDNQVWMKPGDSPVSQADLAVNEYLQKHLLSARPNYGWLSEETEDNAERLEQKRIFVVDPIDGTRGFIEGKDEWCVSVAIVEEARPLAAILECPALNETYCASTNSQSRMNSNLININNSDEISLVTGSRKINNLMNDMDLNNLKSTKFIPSLAYRIALVAAGKIDLALARPGAHDWDLAAVDLILANAGGSLFDLDGKKLLYNRNKLQHKSLLACATHHQKSALALAKSAGILH